MQVVAYCEEKTFVNELEQDDQDNQYILHFSLPGVLRYTLALSLTLGTLSVLSSSGGQPQLMMQQQFTDSELSLLHPLLESFPYYCPYEVLYANFYNGTVTDKIVARCRQRLEKAREAGSWEREMKPVRNVLSRTRLKLQTLGINVSSILETGCILRSMPTSKASEKV